MARRASTGERSPQSESRHPGHVSSGPSAGIRRAAQRRRSATGLIAGIIALGLFGLCLRTVPIVLTDSNLVDQIAGPFTGVLVGFPGKPSTVAPASSTSAAASADVTPVKLQAKRKAKRIHQVEVPGSGPGTYQAAK